MVSDLGVRCGSTKYVWTGRGPATSYTVSLRSNNYVICTLSKRAHREKGLGGKEPLEW